jgi:DNA replication licensing factor MCM5
MNGERVYFADAHHPVAEHSDNNLIEGTNTHFQFFFSKFLESFSRENIRIYHRQL